LIEQRWQWSDQAASREPGLYAIDRSLASRGVGANAEFHQYDRRKKTNDVTHTTKDPIGVKICTEVVDKYICIEQYFAGYR
jgi:hypothetical protein